MRLANRAREFIILGLTLLAFLLRAYRLDAQSYWIDKVITGLYDARTGQRLPVSGGGDFVELGMVTVPPKLQGTSQ